MDLIYVSSDIKSINHSSLSKEFLFSFLRTTFFWVFSMKFLLLYLLCLLGHGLTSLSILLLEHLLLTSCWWASLVIYTFVACSCDDSSYLLLFCLLLLFDLLAPLHLFLLLACYLISEVSNHLIFIQRLCFHFYEFLLFLV